MNPSGGYVTDSDGEPIVTEPCRGCGKDLRMRQDAVAQYEKDMEPVLCAECHERDERLREGNPGPEWSGDDAMEKR